MSPRMPPSPATPPDPEALVSLAVSAAAAADDRLQEALEQLDAPVYVTDAQGVVTYFNSACVDFAGRRPAPGEDRWCVTWKLYALDGTAMPHDQCPMASAIRQKRPNRGLMAVAARPDGKQVLFLPFPTPILDPDGELVGAVNLLLGLDPAVEARRLREHAERCRRLAKSIFDTEAIATLGAMADEYSAKAASLSRLGCGGDS